MKKLIFYIFFLHINIYLSAQENEIYFNHLSVEDGLLVDWIDFIFQDSKGFMWICQGIAGVQKYDGYKFTTPKFQNRTNVSESPYYSSIIEDQRGLLWFGTHSGVDIFDPVTEQSLFYQPEPKNTNWPNKNHVTGIFCDSEKTIWLATVDGLIRLKEKDNNKAITKENVFEQGVDFAFSIKFFKPFPDVSSGNKNWILSIHEDSSKNLLLGVNWSDGLYIFQREKEEFSKIEFKIPNDENSENIAVYDFVEDNYGNYWIGTNHGICRIKNLNGQIDKSVLQNLNLEIDLFQPGLGYKGHNFVRLVVDKKGGIWAGNSFESIFHIDNINDKHPDIKEYSRNVKNSNSLSSTQIREIFQDRNENIWIGHPEGSIDIFTTNTPDFKSYVDLVLEHFKGTNINPILEDDNGDIWVGDYGTGLYKVSKGTNKVNHYEVNVGKDNYNKNNLNVIKEDNLDDNILWIGSGDGVYQFNKQTESFNIVNDSISVDQGVRSIIFKNEWVIINKWQDILLYNRKTENINTINEIVNGTKIHGIFFPWASYLAKNGDIWIGVEEGLFKLQLNVETGEVSFYQRPGLYPKHFTSMNKIISSIREDRLGNLWLATFDGISKYEPKTEELTHYFTRDKGYNNTWTFSLEIDNKGRIWAGTDYGLVCLNPANGRISTYAKRDGVPIGHHWHPGSYKTKDGKMYFGGADGFYSFFPDSFEEAKYIPEIVLTDLKLFGKSLSPLDSTQNILSKSISFTTEIELKHNQNDLLFEFTALDFTYPEKNKYEYILEGYQDEWVQTTAKNRNVQYTNLDPGEYVFRVIGSNSNGIWNKEGTSLKITVHPPWWETWWFRTILVLFFITIGPLIYYLRVRKLKKEKHVLESRVKERTHLIEEQKEELLQQKEELQITLENLQATQEKLIESEKMAAIGGLVAGVAHEINTPVGIGVTAISSLLDETQKMAEFYKKGEISRKGFKEFLQSAHDSGQLIQKNLVRTAELIQSFKKVSVDQTSEQQRVFNLKSYIEDIIRSLHPEYKHKNIEFKIICNENLELNSYPGAYAQIFTNLILNSVKHGFKDLNEGTISIVANQNHNNIKIDYIDNGKGINPEDLPHIFEPFYTSSKKTGTGLGLNIVHNLVKQRFQGEITCKSDLGKGVIFELYLKSDIIH